MDKGQQHLNGRPAHLHQPRTVGTYEMPQPAQRGRKPKPATPLPTATGTGAKGTAPLWGNAAELAAAGKATSKTDGNLTYQEMYDRTEGLQKWLRHNMHQPNWKGVAMYQAKLIGLMYGLKKQN